MIKCKRCNGLSFQFVDRYVFGLAYLQCLDCEQGHLFVKKGEIKAVEVSHSPVSYNNSTILDCSQCGCMRIVSVSGDMPVRDVSRCNRCVEGSGELVKSGEKLNWQEFQEHYSKREVE